MSLFEYLPNHCFRSLDCKVPGDCSESFLHLLYLVGLTINCLCLHPTKNRIDHPEKSFDADLMPDDLFTSERTHNLFLEICQRCLQSIRNLNLSCVKIRVESSTNHQPEKQSNKRSTAARVNFLDLLLSISIFLDRFWFVYLPLKSEILGKKHGDSVIPLTHQSRVAKAKASMASAPMASTSLIAWYAATSWQVQWR